LVSSNRSSLYIAPISWHPVFLGYDNYAGGGVSPLKIVTPIKSESSRIEKI
jgi:hypothetical protein